MTGACSAPKHFNVLKIRRKRIEERDSFQLLAMLKILRKDDGRVRQDRRGHDLSVPKRDLMGCGQHDGLLEQLGGEMNDASSRKRVPTPLIQILTKPAMPFGLSAARQRPSPEFLGKRLEFSQGQVASVRDHDLDSGVRRQSGRNWFIKNDRRPVKVSA
jgi:hypothetical protein